MKELFNQLSTVFQFFKENQLICRKAPRLEGGELARKRLLEKVSRGKKVLPEAKREALIKRRKLELAEKRKKLARANLERKGATKTELFAFEEAYDPRARETIKKIIEKQKLKPKLKNPETWTDIHNELVNEKGEYFNKAYADLYYSKFPTEAREMLFAEKKIKGLKPRVAAAKKEKEFELDLIDLSVEGEEEKPKEEKPRIAADTESVEEVE